MSPEQCGMSGQHEHTHMDCRKRISWSAILAGALVGIGLGFLLNLFSIALGLSFVSTTKEGLLTVALTGLIGLIIGTMFVSFASGFTAGYLGKSYSKRQNLGALYGFTTWSVTLILATFLTPALGGYIAFYSDFVTHPTMVVIVNEKNHSMPAMSEPAKEPAVKATIANDKAAKAQHATTEKHPAVNMQAVTGALSVMSMLIFVLFLVGALSSIFGGRCAMKCNDECRV